EIGLVVCLVLGEQGPELGSERFGSAELCRYPERALLGSNHVVGRERPALGERSRVVSLEELERLRIVLPGEQHALAPRRPLQGSAHQWRKGALAASSLAVAGSRRDRDQQRTAAPLEVAFGP